MSKGNDSKPTIRMRTRPRSKHSSAQVTTLRQPSRIVLGDLIATAGEPAIHWADPSPVPNQSGSAKTRLKSPGGSQ